MKINLLPGRPPMWLGWLFLIFWLALILPVKTQAGGYRKLLHRIHTHQQKLIKSYNQGENVRLEAKKFLYQSLWDICEAWEGTAWGFNGTTRVPKQGQIACGYFVTTVLADAGFELDRTRLAQAPSETMIRTLVPARCIDIYSNSRPMSEIVIQTRFTSRQGVFLVGLDNHTGFLITLRDAVYFCHASYVGPEKKVVIEKFPNTSILNHSTYRVIGELLNDDTVEKWLQK